MTTTNWILQSKK